MRTHVRSGRYESLQVLGGTTVIALTLGVLLVLSNLDALRLPSEVYLGLLAVGTFGGAVINGYRSGHAVVSWFSAGIGVFPMALALAPSGPPETNLTIGDILLKAGGWTLVVAFVVGSISYALGQISRRFISGDI